MNLDPTWIAALLSGIAAVLAALAFLKSGRSDSALVVAIQALLAAIRDTLQQSSTTQKESLDQVSDQLRLVRETNETKLEEMRPTVDEKLQDTLEKRLSSSFKQVSDQLEQVFKSVGEMQTLAAGVGDLSRVLTNVRARGTWAEVWLSNLLEQVLVERNVEVKPHSGERVDFAVKLPGPVEEGTMAADRLRVPY